MASREFENFLSSIHDDIVSVDDSTKVARDKLNALHGHPVADSTKVRWRTLGGVPTAWVTTPESMQSDRLLFLCHGGAFIAAGGDGYLFYAEALAQHCKAQVLVVDYRLAPEHIYPAALDDCVTSYQALLREGFGAERIALIGDSCGGGLVISTLLRVRDLGIDMPDRAITLGGWLDLDAEDSSTPATGRDPFANARLARARGRDYVGVDGDLRDPLVSPVHANLAGLPPLLIQVGQIDFTREQALTLTANAARDGVAVTLEIWPEMVQGFQGLAAAGIAEGIEALKHVREFIH